MNLLIMGPPGSGKGTQSKYICEKYNIIHVSTGDMFRTAVAEKTEVGLLAKGYLDSGEYVPDSVTVRMVEERLTKKDCQNGFLLDGFPRTLEQAECLQKILKSQGKKLDKVINVEADTELIIKRLSGRRVCPKCGSSYHLKTQPPKVENVCDRCGADLIIRPDDCQETVENRIKVYLNNSADLLKYYKNLDLIVTVNGGNPIGTIFKKICIGISENDNN